MSRSIRIATPEPPTPRLMPLAYERVVTAFAAVALLVGMLVPSSAFAATRNWSLTRTPAMVVGGAPASVQVTATNVGDDGGGEAVGCVVIAIPASAFTVTNVTLDSVSDGDNWSASFSGDGTWWFVSLVSNSGGGNRLHALESVDATVIFNDTGVDGTFTWTGNAYNKEDCTDDFLMPRTVSVTIDGAVVDNPPLAQADAYGTGRNAVLTVGAPGVLSNDSDPDGDPLTAMQTSSPADGSLTWGGDGSFTYAPDPGFVGTDSFTYHADDASTASADVTVSITVTNTVPAATDDVYSVGWSQPLIVGAPGMLGNDTDPDGDSLSSSIVSGPSNGTLLPAGDGSFTYLPNLLFVGTDSFVYAASDGVDSSQATVFINVSNAPPVANDDGPHAVAEDTTLTVSAPGVLGNDTDSDGDSLTASLVTDAANGTVTLAADGSFDYVPDSDFAGADSFTYEASDGIADSAVATVSITVSAVGDPPVAFADTYAAAEDTTLVVPAPGVLGNDTEVDGDPLSATVLTVPSNGQLTLDPSGSLTYDPDPDFHGTDSFTYAVSDGSTSDSATVTLTVSAVNDAPVASADSKAAAHATSVLIDVLANDTDVDGDGLAISGVGTPSTGAAVIEAGRIRYTPPTGFAGSATFTYSVSDGTTTDTASVTVTVAPEPTPVPTPTPNPTPIPSPSATPQPTPVPTPVGSPTATSSPPVPAPSPADPPAAEATPEPTDAPVSEPPASTSPQPTQSPPVVPPSPPAAGDPVTLLPLAAPQVTTSFDSTENLFQFAGLFGGFGGTFAWAMPAAMLGVPGLLFMLAVAGQLLGAAAWVPTIKRMLAGVGVRRRRRD